MLPLQAVRLVKPTSLIRDADLSLRIAGLPVRTYTGRRKRETELRRPTCYFCAGYNWAGTAKSGISPGLLRGIFINHEKAHYVLRRLLARHHFSTISEIYRELKDGVILRRNPWDIYMLYIKFCLYQITVESPGVAARDGNSAELPDQRGIPLQMDKTAAVGAGGEIIGVTPGFTVNEDALL